MLSSIVIGKSGQHNKSDLDIYLEEGVDTTGEEFNVLNWWKESAFSVGGRVLDQYRSSLAAEMMNALVCTSSWFRSKDAVVIVSPSYDYLVEEDKAVKFPDNREITIEITIV